MPTSMKPERSAWQRWGWVLRWLGTAHESPACATLIDFVDDVKSAKAVRISAGATLGLAILLVALNATSRAHSASAMA